MENPLLLRHFLGANSRGGFSSLYGGITRPDLGEFLYIIKGGPGCGKSGFMARISAAAAERGLAAEHILCSGDPDSLDGLVLPELGLALVDGTAPHSMEAAFPAGSSLYIDLGRFYDEEALRPQNPQLMELSRRSRELYAAAYARISAAADILPRCLPELLPGEERGRIRKKLSALVRRELPAPPEVPGRIHRRFLSSLGSRGPIRLPCRPGRLWLLDNELGAANFYLQTLADMLAEQGRELWLYHDCLDPRLLSGLYIPDGELSLLAPEPGWSLPEEPERRIHCDAPLRRGMSPEEKSELRRAKKLSLSLLELASDTLARAGRLHKELEMLYNPHVDFAAVRAEADSFIAKHLP